MESAMAEAERLFSSDPISYRMDRRSSQACNLRDAISKKLLDFLGNYSDDVLAEYIVVLVCNGKHQVQARDDLEAFLGDDSGKFVAWLWNHLSKEHYISKTTLDCSDRIGEVRDSHQDALSKEHEPSGQLNLQIHSAGVSDIPLPKDGIHEPSYLHCSNTTNMPENLQRWCPSTDPPSTEDVNERLQSEKMVANKYPCSSDSSKATKYLSSTVSCSLQIPSDVNQHLHYRNPHQKIANIESSVLLPQSLSVPRTEQHARGLRSCSAEDQQLRTLSTRNSAKRRLLSPEMDSLPHQNTRPRGNVWDRLGKPHNEDGEQMGGKKYHLGNTLIKKDHLDDQRDELQNSWSTGGVLDVQLSNNLDGKSKVLDLARGKAIFTNHVDEFGKQEYNPDAVIGPSHMNNAKRKKVYSEFKSGNSSASYSGHKGNDIQVKGAPPELNKSLSVKYSRPQSLNEVTSEGIGSKGLFSEPSRPKVTTASQNLATVRSRSPSKAETSNDTVCGNAKSRPVKKEVLDVKSRLRQVEMDVLKLRTKQAEMSSDKSSSDVKPNGFLGTQSHTEEDIESRTVLVTNVHFAASREALLSHFSKCGIVAKVVMLTDTITAQPKGAAYVVFANKDSVEKAVSLSGTSFFSRILTVTRKADVPPDFLVPSQPAGKLLPPIYPQPYRKVPVQRLHTSSHLQWKREDNSLPASTNGSECSNAGGS
ncbi:uncharacterized protein M6B38_329225 [Iris pallida]|uniref:RRM domain-containing protein n=1 Tax=Iris pallida TaxID=29817 RepID=A0AAX6H5A8_IRIPA|nr:uncharacterized protein M6B38_329225 [Iris pallida]